MAGTEGCHAVAHARHGVMRGVMPALMVSLEKKLLFGMKDALKRLFTMGRVVGNVREGQRMLKAVERCTGESVGVVESVVKSFTELGQLSN